MKDILEVKMERYLTEDQALPDAIEAVVELLGSVRAEAIGWTWTEACSMHDKGLDPRTFEVPILMDRASADLNPDRE